LENSIYNLEVEFSFNKGMTPDTNSPPYDSHVMSPEFAAWGEWLLSGTAVYPYISEFIARYIQMNMLEDLRIMNSTMPLYKQTIGYAPMTTQKYIKIDPESSSQLSTWYPFFFMIIQLIPFYYITSKLSSEKENKTREGMKMMGMPISNYYIATSIFYFFIAILTSLIVSTITCNYILKKV
jgi:hypothetical protein